MYKVVALSISILYCAPALAAPGQSPAQSLSPTIESSIRGPGPAFAAPVPIFRAPDPGIPADIGAAAAAVNPVTSGTIQQTMIPMTVPAGGGIGVGAGNNALLPTDTTPGHRGGLLVPPVLPAAMRLAAAAPIHTSTAASYDTATGHLKPGNFLLTPADDTSIATAFGTVRIAGRSAVLLASTVKSLTVYDLHDRHSSSVVWEAAGRQQIKLLPGWQLTITNDLQAPLGEINPCSTIALRSLQSETLSGGTRIFLGNFYIASALAHLEPLRHDQHVIKAAAIQGLTRP
jgi:hypothetical protein